MEGADREARHLDPRVRTVWRVSALIGSAIVVAAANAAALAWTEVGDGPAAAWLGAAAVSVAAVVAAWSGPAAHYRRWTYRLGDEAVELEHGVVVRTRSVIPYFRVQHVDTDQGPIERRVGLTNLTIHTASSATDAALPGLALEEAVRVRTIVLERAGTGDAV